MSFFRTIALMVVGYVALKSLKRVAANLEAQQVKAKVKQPQQSDNMPRLKLDPITGVYVPEA